MNREDIIRMAQEAQMPFYWRTGEITYLDKLERFAALVAFTERDACAELFDERYKDIGWYDPGVPDEIIRARGQE